MNNFEKIEKTGYTIVPNGIFESKNLSVRAVTRKTVMPQRATFAHLCRYSSSEYIKYSSSS